MIVSGRMKVTLLDSTSLQRAFEREITIEEFEYQVDDRGQWRSVTAWIQGTFFIDSNNCTIVVTRAGQALVCLRYLQMEFESDGHTVSL